MPPKTPTASATMHINIILKNVLSINGTTNAPSKDPQLMMVTNKKPNPQAKHRDRKLYLNELFQGPRSNFWIEGAECLASQGRGGGWGNNRVPILASFFFNIFPFFFNYLAAATCSCLLLVFRSLLVNIVKNI